MVGLMQRAAPRGQQLDGLAYAVRLVDGALLADRQVHGQMQERVGAAFAGVIHLADRGGLIGKVSVVFRVLVDPLASQGFDGFHGLVAAGLGVDGAVEAADVFLGGGEHGERG